MSMITTMTTEIKNWSKEEKKEYTFIVEKYNKVVNELNVSLKLSEEEKIKGVKDLNYNQKETIINSAIEIEEFHELSRAVYPGGLWSYLESLNLMDDMCNPLTIKQIKELYHCIDALLKSEIDLTPLALGDSVFNKKGGQLYNVTKEGQLVENQTFYGVSLKKARAAYNSIATQINYKVLEVITQKEGKITPEKVNLIAEKIGEFYLKSISAQQYCTLIWAILEDPYTQSKEADYIKTDYSKWGKATGQKLIESGNIPNVFRKENVKGGTFPIIVKNGEMIYLEDAAKKVSDLKTITDAFYSDGGPVKVDEVLKKAGIKIKKGSSVKSSEVGENLNKHSMVREVGENLDKHSKLHNQMFTMDYAKLASENIANLSISDEEMNLRINLATDLATMLLEPVQIPKPTKEMTDFEKKVHEHKVKAGAVINKQQERDDLIRFWASLITIPQNLDNIVFQSNINQSLNGTQPAKLLPLLEILGDHVFGIGVEGEPEAIKVEHYVIPALPLQVKEYIQFTTLQQLYLYFMVKMFENTSGENKAAFISSLAKFKPNAKQEGSIIVFNKTTKVSLESGVITRNGRILLPTKHFHLNTWNTKGSNGVFLLALTMINKSSEAQSVIIGKGINIFQKEDNYGEKWAPGSTQHHVNENLSKTIGIISYGVNFPFVQFDSKQLDPFEAKTRIDKGELLATDKNNKKWITEAEGARALGIGKNPRTGFFECILDATKEEKIKNRVAQNNFTAAHLPNRKNSNFGFLTNPQTGKTTQTSGYLVKGIWSNSRLTTSGSGQAFINKETTFDFRVPKVLIKEFNLLTIPADIRARLGKTLAEQTDTVCQLIENGFFSVEGTKVNPGDAIIALSLDGIEEEKVLVRNDSKAVELIIDGGEVFRNSDGYITIKVEATYEDKSQWVKLRGSHGIKVTTQPYEVTIPGVDKWDILLNIESVKGFVPLIMMFCAQYEESHPGKICYIDPDTSLLHLPDGEIVDFHKEENQFTKWCQDTKKETWVRFNVVKSEWMQLQKVWIKNCEQNPKAVKEDIDFRIVGEGPGFYTIEEKIEYIEGPLYVEIEVSTPKENVSVAQMTLEQQMALTLQAPFIGKYITKKLVHKVDALKGLAKTMKPVNDEPTECNVLDPEDREDLRAKLIKVGMYEKGKFISQKDLLAKMEQLWPKGMRFFFTTRSGSKKTMDIHFGALKSLGGFANGGASREMGRIMEFLQYLTGGVDDNQGEQSGIDSRVVRLMTNAQLSLKSWGDKMIESSNVLKKITRAGEYVNLKVRTSFNPILHSPIKNVPVIALNPNDPVVKLLGLDPEVDDHRLGGEQKTFIGVMRVPMPMMTSCLVVFDECVGVGHFLIGPVTWHRANEGKLFIALSYSNIILVSE